MINSLTVRDIEVNVHEIKNYVNFFIYLLNKDDSKKMIEIYREMHLIDDLKINMLINNDILEWKEIIVKVQKKKTIIRICQNMIIEMKISQKDSFVKWNVITQFVNVVSSNSYVKISYKIKNLSFDRDFLFESSFSVSLLIYVHVIQEKTTEVIVCNKSEKSMKISKNFKLEIAQQI
jgi:hypothetical protein